MSQTKIDSNKKTLRFYSKEEKKALAPFMSKKMPVNEENLRDFCKKYNRTYASAQVYIYTNRKKKIDRKQMLSKNSPKAALKPMKRDSSTVNLSKGEFKIPINKWNMQNEDGQLYFVVKF